MVWKYATFHGESDEVYKVAISEGLKNLREVMDHCKTENIFNMDETG